MELFFVGGGLIHIGVCSFLYHCLKTKKIRASLNMFPLVVFIPLWGALCVLATDMLYRQKRPEKTAKHARVNPLTASLSSVNSMPSAPVSISSRTASLSSVNSRTRSLSSVSSRTASPLSLNLTPSSPPAPARFVEKDSSSPNIVPLEEAMLVNNPSTRRALILDVLQGSSAQDLSVLKEVGFMGDTEVMHYAATIMVEIQEKLEANLHRAKKVYQVDPENINSAKQYAQSLHELISSGLLEGSILHCRRVQYGKLMDDLILHSPDDLELFIQWADNQIALGKSKATRKAVNNAIEKWNFEERLLIQSIRLNATLGYSQDIQDTVKKVEKNHTVLSHKAQDAMAFWSRSA